jgi:hypothetical protein
MLKLFQGATLVAATMTVGLMAGVFGLYAPAIMPGLDKTDDRTFVDAFQSIDRAIINPMRADVDDSRRRQRPLLDLFFGRLPPAVPPAPGPRQLPHIAIPRLSLDRLVSGRGIKARLSVGEAGPADAVLVELYSRALGNELPVALGYARFSRPGTKAVSLVMPGIVRRLVGRRSRLRTRVLLSQCTGAGYEYTARRRIVLRRR